MTRFLLIALALAFTFNLTASQTLVVETCPAAACNNSCMNCSNSSVITHNNTANPLVLCPQNASQNGSQNSSQNASQNASQNGSFCWIQNYWSNGTWTLQNCSSCSNTSANSCNGCAFVNRTFEDSFCANGTCWLIDFNNTNNGTNGTANGTNTTTTVISSLNCNCTNATTGISGLMGVDLNGNACVCPVVVNTTSHANGTTGTVNSSAINGSFTVASAAYLKFCLGAMSLLAVLLLL